MINQLFLDPLYGRIEVDRETTELIFSPEFQRLRYVRLCNINSLFITGASETKRFEHCIGVYHLARVWSTENRLPPPQARVLHAAALLHDLQTGPFGHSFQYVLEDNTMGDLFEHANIDKGVRSQFNQQARAGMAFAGRPFSVGHALGTDAAEVFANIRGEGRFGPLISGTLDLDNLDNVVRLAYHSGLCAGDDRFLPCALTRKLRVIDGRLAAASDAQLLIERWYEIRADLYRYLLLDFGEFSAKAMLTLAVERAIGAQLLGPDSWLLTDDELLRELENASIGEYQTIGQITRRLRVGDLFEPVGVWSTPKIECYDSISIALRKREIEARIEQIARTAGKSSLRCCVHFIKDHRKTRRAISYIELESGHCITVGDDSHELHVGVFITNARDLDRGSSELSRFGRAALRALAEFGITDLKELKSPLAGAALGAQPQLLL